MSGVSLSARLRHR